MSNNSITDIGAAILQIEMNFDLLRAIKPINLDEELDQFKSLYTLGLSYNPIFKYDSRQIELAIASIKELRALLARLTEVKSPRIASLLEEKILEQISYCDLAASIGNDIQFGEKSIAIFGPTSLADAEIARIEVLGLPASSSNNTDGSITPSDFCKIIAKDLELVSSDWTVTVDAISARINVDCSNKVIEINKSDLFSSLDATRLRIHEVWTHALRAENGSRQNLRLLQTGLAKSLDTEEGLAVYSEQRNNLLDVRTMRLYCARVVACHLAESHSFLDIYRAVEPIAPHDALHITHRVKRGIVDTSRAGGFTKDKVYYSGWKMVANFFSSGLDQEYASLYCGGVGLHQLPIVREAISLGEISPPHSLPPFFDKLIHNRALNA